MLSRGIRIRWGRVFTLLIVLVAIVAAGAVWVIQSNYANLLAGHQPIAVAKPVAIYDLEIPKIEPPAPPPTPEAAATTVSAFGANTLPQRDAGNNVYLTFDDGPDGNWTPKIMSVLNSYNAKATFFVLGSRVGQNAGIVQELVRNGHSVQNHSWNHADFTKISASTLVNTQLDQTNSAIAAAAGTPATCVRPPYGAVNGSVKQTIANSGMQMALWTIDTNDYQRPPASQMVAHVLANVQPGSVILMHDGGAADRSQTLAAVEQLVPALQNKGFQLKALCR